MRTSDTTSCHSISWTGFKDLFKEWDCSKTICASIVTKTNATYESIKQSFPFTLNIEAPIQSLNTIFRKNPQKITLESLLDKIPNPKDRSEALQLLFLSEQEASDTTIVREHYMLLITKLKSRLSKNTSSITRPWLSTMINYGQEAYRTLGGDPKEDDGKPYADPD